ncbi:hypothetical protein ALI144C_06500 [Actinosynnema sp. ALI-1.44]|uniref:DUF4279 domain-containing protein n=1 Tax=Actinosynnema sp. ALI-1.44 TaxID=1933779 RepID=UPI00097BE3C1|nr:DUF4279 domain-containing protein [Actinosynnema sp. ALI-1.44]ONI88669.1 hypothetical protein ALI144C_06500 [Actinosynnema sp. ALI-1.44]
MFWIYLRVVSDSLPPEEITSALAVEPDWAHAKGSKRHPHATPRAFTTWAREVTGGRRDEHPMEFGGVITGWGMPFAKALAGLADRGEATAGLTIVQEVRDIDSPQQKGLWLTRTRSPGWRPLEQRWTSTSTSFMSVRRACHLTTDQHSPSLHRKATPSRDLGHGTLRPSPERFRR